MNQIYQLDFISDMWMQQGWLMDALYSRNVLNRRTVRMNHPFIDKYRDKHFLPPLLETVLSIFLPCTNIGLIQNNIHSEIWLSDWYPYVASFYPHPLRSNGGCSIAMLDYRSVNAVSSEYLSPMLLHWRWVPMPPLRDSEEAWRVQGIHRRICFVWGVWGRNGTCMP